MKTARIKAAFLLALGAFSLVGGAYAQAIDEVAPPVEVSAKLSQTAKYPGWQKKFKQATEEGMATLVDLAQGGDPKRFGLAGTVKPSDLSVLAPLPEFVVKMGALQKFKAGDNAASLLIDGRVLRFPVVEDKWIRSSIVLVEREGVWRLAEVGEALTIRAAMRIRAKLEPGPHVFANGKANPRLVTALGLNAQFLAVDGPIGTTLYPLFGYATFKAGEPASITKVFEALSHDAKNHNGLPS